MLLTLMWFGVAAGMFTIIAAAMKVQQASVCKGYLIKISGSGDGKLFTTQDQVTLLLKAATKGNITGQHKTDFNLPVMEDLLEQSSWVYNAEIYFDNQDVLHVNVIERKPLARIFNVKGESYYIDETGRHIPLSDKVTLDVPVFTSYPDKKIFNVSDSALLQNMIATASFITSDSFWAAQVSEININSCGADCWDMQMIPSVGNHKVDLGDGSDIASKFHRLYLFYDQVLKRTGFDKYQKVDVQYDGQVIGIKENYTKVDSLQLRKNIEQLLLQSRKTNEMIEVAPKLDVKPVLKADTSAEAKRMYQPVEGAESDSMFQSDDAKRETKPVASSPKAKPKNESGKANAFQLETPKNVMGANRVEKKPVTEKAAKATKKSETTEKSAVKKEVKKAELKKTDKKPEVTKKPLVKKDAKKPDTKKAIAPSKKLEVTKKPVAKKDAKKTDTKK
jgi:hypothetical protein